MKIFKPFISSPHEQHQMSESFAVGSLLSVVGGYLDAYSYMARGEVFANAQTGNFVLLGIHLATGAFDKAVTYILPIGAFAAGVFLTEFLRRVFFTWGKFHWRQAVIIAELLFLATVAFLPQKMNTIATIIISFVCALQVESFRKIHGNPFTTTMCTGNLRSGTEQLFLGVKLGKRRSVQAGIEYYGVILFFVGGAVLGVLLTRIWAERAVLFACVLLFCVFLLIFVRAGDS